MAVAWLAGLAALAAVARVAADEAEKPKKVEPPMMRTYLQRLYDAVPFTTDEVTGPADWPAWREKTLASLRKALGLEQLPKRTPLNARVVGRLDRRDYIVEKVVFETRPNFYMTANFYRLKELKGRVPAVLCVHGHAMDGKANYAVQTRAINYARAGWVALAVDATGHGERVHIGHRRTFAIITTGMTLEGVQVWDNMRAVDYLLTRPEVDPRRIAISGASGGGNQTMYTAALDERLAVAVPVASVSTLRGQIFTDNGIGCQCECIPDLMRYGLENATVLALVAPRPLCQVNDRRDPVFPYQYASEAARHIARFYEAVGHPDRYRFATISARQQWHGYHGLARTEAHRWLDKWFNNLSEESTFRDVQPPLEQDQDLFCFPAGRLPEDSETLGSLAYALARQQVARLRVPKTEPARRRLRDRIRDEVLGGFPERGALDARETEPATVQGITRWAVTLTSEPGITIAARIRRPAKADGPLPCVVVVREKPERTYWAHAQAWLEQGYAVAELDPRPLGDDEHVSRAALVLGRPLVGMGAYDISRFADYLETRPEIDAGRILLWADGVMTMPALYALALDPRLAGGTLVGLLTTYVSPTPVQHPTWTFVRSILTCADLEHLAALAAPRPLFIANPVGPDLAPVAKTALSHQFPAARQAYGRAGRFRLFAGFEDQHVEEAVEFHAAGRGGTSRLAGNRRP